MPYFLSCKIAKIISVKLNDINFQGRHGRASDII